MAIKNVFQDATWPQGLEFVTTDNLKLSQNLERSGRDPEIEGKLPTSEDVAFLQFTSGSTGDPKGVMLSHANLLHNVSTIASALGTEPEHVGVSWVPQYHDMGLIGVILQSLFVGAHMVLMSPQTMLRDPFVWLKACDKYKAHQTCGMNGLYAHAANKISDEQAATLDLGSLRVYMSGGEPIRAQTVRAFSSKFAQSGLDPGACYPCLGMAENAVYVTGRGTKTREPSVLDVDADALAQGNCDVLASADPEARRRQLVGCGIPGDGILVEIVHPDECSPVPEGRIGEIWVTGPSKAMGYWGKPDQSRETFQARLCNDDSNSWLRSGDLGFLHAGELYVCGRLKDLVIIRGRNVYPQDIEQSLEASHPSLRPGCSAAFALETDGTEQLAVMAEVRNGHDTPELCRDILAAVEAAVLEEHGLRCSVLLLVRQGQVPKTTSGKIKRFACKQVSQTWLEQRDQPASVYVSWCCCPSRGSSSLEVEVLDARVGQSDVVCRPALPGKCTNLSGAVAAVQQAVEHATGRSHGPDESLLGLSSMMVVTLCEELTGVFGKKVDATTIMEADTINALCSLMLSGAALSAREQEKERSFDHALEQYNDDQLEGASPVTRGLRFTGTVVQFLTPVVIFLLATSCLVPVYYVGKGVQYDGWVATPWSHVDLHPHRTLGVLVPMLIPLWMAIFTAAVVLVKWTLIGRYTEGQIWVNSHAYLRWGLADRLVAFWELWVARFLSKTVALTLVYKALGANVCTSSKINTFIREFDLITVGEASTVDGDLVARSLYPEHASFLSVVIGDGVNLHKCSCVRPGSLFADAATLRPLSVAPLGSVADAGIAYCGNPMLAESSTPCTGHAGGELAFHGIMLAAAVAFRLLVLNDVCATHDLRRPWSLGLVSLGLPSGAVSTLGVALLALGDPEFVPHTSTSQVHTRRARPAWRVQRLYVAEASRARVGLRERRCDVHVLQLD
eukprot:TRINITY_DN5686_c0_g1_i3.p1 TRINITY_DN5686_c0_g1~~TRINITY_DN5686_c0_g1_i3.p1  ORF type:complete len:960 (-),score=141.72 TRINITY_DN5686_c0_g1_i3:1490-4369(-)